MSKSKPLPPPPFDNKLIIEKNLISFLYNDEEIIELIKELNYSYVYWDQLKRKIIPEKIDHENLWQMLKISRKIAARNLNISTLKGFSFSYNMTEYITKQLHRFDLNLGGVLEGSTTIPEGQGEKYMISALMEEAIASSQLEGAATTRKIAKEMLRSQRKPKNQSERMILNNYLTIQEIKKHRKDKLTPELICKLHKIITAGTLENGKNEGVYRMNDNINVVDAITGELYYSPPDFKIIEDAIKDICEFANAQNENGKDFVHPIIKAITLHFLIGYLHPFVDGNGRTARALFYWFLLSKGYWLLEYISISKIILNSPSQYSRAYICSEDDGNDLTYFYQYNLKVLMTATKEFKSYIARKIQEKAEVYALQSLKGLNDRQVEILQKIRREKHKFFTIKEIQGIFNVAYQTARMDLLELHELGYLSHKKSGLKTLFYKSKKFDEVLSQGKKDTF
jgi:Fic family protein